MVQYSNGLFKALLAILFLAIFSFLGTDEINLGLSVNPKISLQFLQIRKAAASAVFYYVATNGSDSNSGSQASPFLTIQKAIGVASAGDTIIVKDGVYGKSGCGFDQGFAVDLTNKAGIAGSPITIKAENTRRAVLDAEDYCHSYFNLGSGAAYINIEDFIIRRGRWGAIWSNQNAHHIVIKGNEIKESGKRAESSGYGIVGIYTGPNSSDIQIDGNLIHDIGRIPGSPYDWHDQALYIGGSDNITVANNIFYDFHSGWAIAPAGRDGNPARNIVIANNTFAGNAGGGRDGQIATGDYGVENLTIRNNIFYLPKTAAIVHCATRYSGPNLWDYNLVYGYGAVLVGGDVCGGGGSGTFSQSSNYINIDPLFKNVNNSDFHTQASSPAINAGAAVAQASIDFDRIARPQGSAYDIGAYEYLSDVVPPVASDPIIITPLSINFPEQEVGKVVTCAADNGTTCRGITITNSGSSAITMGLGTLSNTDFSFANFGDCPNAGSQLAAGQSCIYSVKFSPTALGLRTGTFVINYTYGSGMAGLKTISLSGTGFSAVAPDVVAPTIPTNLKASQISTTQIDLSWSASTDNVGVAGYRVYRNGSLIAEVAAVAYRDSGLIPDTDYSYSLQAYDAAGNVSAQTALVWGRTVAESLTQGPWTGTYYLLNKKFNLSTQITSRVDQEINFDWGTGSPDSRVPANSFGVKWTGTFNFPTAGNYEFKAITDDGMRIYIDGVKVLDKWWTQVGNYTFTRSLSAGKHSVQVHYFENTGYAKASVSWVKQQVAGAFISSRLTKKLYPGSRDPEVITLQQMLWTLGYLNDYQAGIFDVVTVTAVKKFQADNHLPTTGIVGILTRTILNDVSS